MKQLNKAFREMSQDPENNDARLNYYGVLADTDLFLLLEQETSNEILEPKFIQLEGNNFALAFDSEENLSEFYGEAAAFAQITGRVLAKMLLEEKIGLGINLGVSEGELLLPWEIIEWFVNVLDETPNLIQTTPKKFSPVKAFPEIMFKALQEKLKPAVGLFDEIWMRRHRHGRASAASSASCARDIRDASRARRVPTAIFPRLLREFQMRQ